MTGAQGALDAFVFLTSWRVSLRAGRFDVKNRFAPCGFPSRPDELCTNVPEDCH